MDAVDAALLDAVGALLLAEAGAVGGQGQRHLLLFQSLVDEAADHGMLAGADQVQVLALDLVHHGIHLREGHNALHHVAVHHEGRDHIGKALADHKVTGVSQHCLVQAGNVAQQVVEALASHAACGIHINAVKALHDLGVVRDLKIRHHRLAKALCFHIAAVVRADGHAGVDHLGDGVQDLLDACSQLLLLGLQLCHTVCICLDRCIVGVDLCLDSRLLSLIGTLLQLAVQGAVGLAELIAGSLQVLHLFQALPVSGILLNDLVHQGQLMLLELFADVFLHRIRVLPDKLDIQHDVLSLSLFQLRRQRSGALSAPFKGGAPPWIAIFRPALPGGSSPADLQKPAAAHRRKNAP